MKWSEHISNVMSKAIKTLGMAKRNFWNCSKNVKETVYSQGHTCKEFLGGVGHSGPTV